MLFGIAGSGKTLLLNMIINEFCANKIYVVVFASNLSIENIMRLIPEDLKKSFNDLINEIPLDFPCLYRTFQKILFSLSEQNKELLIVIDEAQNVPRETLEGLRLLLNIEKGKKNYFMIILIFLLVFFYFVYYNIFIKFLGKQSKVF